MVDSVVMMVFKSTAMMLFNKGKKRALAKLQHSGDAIDQTICSLIAGELDEIKSELRAASSGAQCRSQASSRTRGHDDTGV